MTDWRRILAVDIQRLLGAAGAEEVTITLPAAQADHLSRGLTLWANITDTAKGPAVLVTGRCGPRSARTP